MSSPSRERRERDYRRQTKGRPAMRSREGDKRQAWALFGCCSGHRVRAHGPFRASGIAASVTPPRLLRISSAKTTFARFVLPPARPPVR
jgi:hypothetical protein